MSQAAAALQIQAAFQATPNELRDGILTVGALQRKPASDAAIERYVSRVGAKRLIEIIGLATALTILDALTAPVAQ